MAKEKKTGWVNRKKTPKSQSTTVSEAVPTLKQQAARSPVRNDRSHTEAVAVINELDDIDKVINWLEHGKIDCKRLGKRLPKTTEDLRNGSTEPDDVVNQLMGIIWANEHAQFVGLTLTEHVVPVKADEDLNCEFLCSLKEKLRPGTVVADWKAGTARISFDLFKEPFDETCRELETRITDRLFQGRQGAFQRSCRLFNIPEVVFCRIVREELFPNYASQHQGDMTRLRRLETDLNLAADALTKKWDVIQKVCWECDKQFDSVKECAQCQIATYCGSDCQLQAWDTGHKKACPDLKQMNEAYLGSLQTVENFHDAGGRMHGMQLSVACDYALTALIHINRSPFDSRMEGPSMSILYENLGRIVQGEWWLFSNTKTAPGYKTASSHAGKSLQDEKDYFTSLLCLLAFDYFKFLATVHGITDPAEITSILENWAGSAITQAKDAFGEKMPAGRFLELYNAGYTSDRSKARKQSKVSALGGLREFHHKAK